jgi:hypothetical protein
MRGHRDLMSIDWAYKWSSTCDVMYCRHKRIAISGTGGHRYLMSVDWAYKLSSTCDVMYCRHKRIAISGTGAIDISSSIDWPYQVSSTLWRRHVLASTTAPPFIVWWSNLETLFGPPSTAALSLHRRGLRAVKLFKRNTVPYYSRENPTKQSLYCDRSMGTGAAWYCLPHLQ